MQKAPEKGFIQLQKIFFLGCYPPSCALAKPKLFMWFFVCCFGDFWGVGFCLFGFFSLRTKQNKCI